MGEAKVEVVDARDRSRFEVLVDGALAGMAEYELSDGFIAFTHTEVRDEFEGQGLASKLARTGLDSARERGLKVAPYCPYIAGWIKKHPDYLDLVHPDHKDRVA